MTLAIVLVLYPMASAMAFTVADADNENGPPNSGTASPSGSRHRSCSRSSLPVWYP
jgi:hypothetical protein